MSIYGDGIARVSDVLDRWGDKQADEGLYGWVAGIGYAWRNVRQHAADVGTHTHSVIETVLSGLVAPWDGQAASASWESARALAWEKVRDECDVADSMVGEITMSLDAFGRWCHDKTIEPERLEETIVDEARAFGGTCDFKGLVNGDRVMLDWKTSKRTYVRHKVQLGAYSLLHEVEHDDEPISFYGTLRLDKRVGTAEDHYWRDLTKERALFLKLLEVHELSKGVKL